MGTVVKVALGVLLGGILLAGACGALIVVGAGLEEVGSDDTEATDAGDRYCSPEKEDEIAALETGSEETINSPRLLRRATGRFLRQNADAPQGADCVDHELDYLVDVWNSSRGDDGYPDAAEQVRRLRKFERR